MTFTPWKARGAAVLSALLLAAAFPPLNWWPLALVGLVPLLWAVWSRPARLGKAVPGLSCDAVLESGTRERDGLAALAGKETHGRDARAPFWPGFRLGWLFGFVFFTATLWWIQHVTLPGMLALTCYLALYPAVAMGIAGWLGMRRDEPWGVAFGKLLLLAGVWAGLEWVRSVALWGFPWNGLAVPLFELCVLRSLAGCAGVTGLSALVLPWAVLVAAVFFCRGRAKVAAGLMLCAGTAIFGGGEWVCSHSSIAEDLQAKTLHAHSALLIQPNVTMEEKMSPDPEVQRQRYFDLVEQTDAALAAAVGPDGKSKVDLVVWPESAVPGFFNDMVQGGAFTDQLSQGDFSLVTGSDHEAWGKLYNSIAVMRGTTGNHAIHPKVKLVPFGEFIPFRKEVPLFEKVLGGLIPMDFTPGTSLEPLRVTGQPFSIVPLVCFEDTIGGHARKFIRAEPQVIVNVTNDNWFHESPATEMHFANARWRAVELRRPLLRSANTGVTAIVSPWGEVQRIPSHQKGSVSGKFHAWNRQITFYAEHGDLFSMIAGGLGLAGCGLVWWWRRRRAGPAVAKSKKALME